MERERRTGPFFVFVKSVKFEAILFWFSAPCSAFSSVLFASSLLLAASSLLLLCRDFALAVSTFSLSYFSFFGPALCGSASCAVQNGNLVSWLLSGYGVIKDSGDLFCRCLSAFWCFTVLSARCFRLFLLSCRNVMISHCVPSGPHVVPSLSSGFTLCFSTISVLSQFCGSLLRAAWRPAKVEATGGH